MTMPPAFNGKPPNNPRKSDYDFLNGVFEWVFYSLPPRTDNSFIRNMYEFYKTRGGLSRKQLTALLHTINAIDAKPPFSTATIEAIIKKKAIKTKAPLPPPTPLYQDDAESKGKLEKILAMAPAHKAALLYMNKLKLHQQLTAADKESIDNFLALLTKRKD
ncbi:MAG: hypothetical protein JWM28_877 [Chitinophagaceae bacterium]|nr:hypothetical protein [Chitinophagaceae bacterium]